MIYDCFLYAGEIDVLELRLNVVGDHVDRFVLVEAGETFSGRPKPFAFEDQADRLRPFADRIRYVKIPRLPPVANPWVREIWQRNQMRRGIVDLKPDDVVFLSDVDEIPNVPAVLPRLRDQPVALAQPLYYYFLNLRLGTWRSAVALRGAHYAISPHELRTVPDKPVVPGAGWHFSYLGDVDFIQRKLASYSHQEFNVAPYNTEENIRRALATRTDLFGRKLDFEVVALDDSFPRHVRDNPERYARFVIPAESRCGRSPDGA